MLRLEIALVNWRGLVRSRRAMISTNQELFSADPPVSFLKKLQPQLQPLGPTHLPDRAQGGPSPRGFLAGPAGALPEQSPNPFPDARQAPLQMKRPWHEGDEAQKEHWTARRARLSEGSPSRRQSVFRPESVWSPSLTDSGRNTDCPVMAFSVSSASLWFIPRGDIRRG